MRLAGPEAMEIVTDCKAVLDTWRLGPMQDLEKVAFSELWEEIFRLASEIGIYRITVTKVKSHLSLTQARRLGVEDWKWLGHKKADELARLGPQAQSHNPWTRRRFKDLEPLIKQSAWLIAEIIDDLSA
eukprot:3276025-Pyramimonas_sp.AAC.1